MIFLHKDKLVILNQPRTGTTALETALSARASMVANRPPELRHMSYRGFMKHVAPLIEAQTGLTRADYEVIAVMREPTDWLGSWYRSQLRDGRETRDDPQSVDLPGDISFDNFVCDICQAEPQRLPRAQIKTPSWVALSDTDAIGIDRLFSYESLGDLHDFIIDRTAKSVETESTNVAPKMELPLLPETREQLRQHFAFEFELHGALSKDGSIPESFRRKGPPSAAHEGLSPGV